LSSAAPEIRLQVGESRELELRGLGSAGYSWEPHLLGPEGIVSVRRVRSGPATRPPAGGPAPPSGSLPELFEVTALAEGAVRVRFVLRREWEPDESPLEESEFDVVVETRSY
jgi:predicted secreted protein